MPIQARPLQNVPIPHERVTKLTIVTAPEVGDGRQGTLQLALLFRSPSRGRKPCNIFLKEIVHGKRIASLSIVRSADFPNGECKKGEDCLFVHPKPPKSGTAGGHSSAGTGQAAGEEPLAPKQSPRAKGGSKGQTAYVAKALLGLVRATQVSVGQSMLVFASVGRLPQ